MKSLYNKVFKNYQVNVGLPFQVRDGLRPNIIKEAKLLEENIDEPLPPSPAEVAEEILANAREEAEMILKEANYEAARVLEDAERQAYEIGRSIEEEAKAKGYEEGLNTAQRQHESLLREAQQIRSNAQAEYHEVLAGMESDIVELILEIAHNVIGTEICINKENVLQLVGQTIDKCNNRETVILRVSPEDYEYIAENKDRLLSMVEGVGELEIKKDNSLKTGGCIVETPYGNIDASVQTKFKKIEEAFRQAVGK